MQRKNNDAGSEVRRRAGFAMVFILFFATPLVACPMCKDSTVDTGQAQATESTNLDFNKSIYVMLGGFAGVVGLTGRVMYNAAKSTR